MVAAPTTASYASLKGLIGFDDATYDNPAFRLAHREPVDAAIAAFCVARNCDELEALGRTHDVAIERVRSIADLAADPHFRAREMFVEWDDPTAGRVKGAGVAPKFSATPGGVWRGAPWLGMDNERILCGMLGYPPASLEELRRAGIVGEHPPGPESPRGLEAQEISP